MISTFVHELAKNFGVLGPRWYINRLRAAAVCSVLTARLGERVRKWTTTPKFLSGLARLGPFNYSWGLLTKWDKPPKNIYIYI